MDQASSITKDCIPREYGGGNKGFFSFESYYLYIRIHRGIRPKFFHHRLKRRINTLKSKIDSLKRYKTYGYEGFSREHMMNIVYYEYYWLANSLDSYLRNSSNALPYYVSDLVEDLMNLELKRCLTNDTEDSLQVAMHYLLQLIKTPPPPAATLTSDVYYKYLIHKISQTLGKIININK